MKKIILTICFLLMAQFFAQAVFADEIIDGKGNVTPCKIITVCEGLIEYQKDGCLYSIQRVSNQPVFNDYVDVRTKLGNKEAITRYSGRIVTVDFGGLKIRTQSEDMQIPWYRIKFIGIFNPN